MIHWRQVERRAWRRFGNEARLKQVEMLAQALLDEHGLQHWRVAFIKTTDTLAAIDLDRRRLEISRLAAMQGDLEITDTLLHEIAHIKTGRELEPHGPKWRRLAVSLGASIENYTA